MTEYKECYIIIEIHVSRWLFTTFRRCSFVVYCECMPVNRYTPHSPTHIQLLFVALASQTRCSLRRLHDRRDFHRIAIGRRRMQRQKVAISLGPALPLRHFRSTDRHIFFGRHLLHATRPAADRLLRTALYLGLDQIDQCKSRQCSVRTTDGDTACVTRAALVKLLAELLQQLGTIRRGLAVLQFLKLIPFPDEFGVLETDLHSVKNDLRIENEIE